MVSDFPRLSLFLLGALLLVNIIVGDFSETLGLPMIRDMSQGTKAEQLVLMGRLLRAGATLWLGGIVGCYLLGTIRLGLSSSLMGGLIVGMLLCLAAAPFYTFHPLIIFCGCMMTAMAEGMERSYRGEAPM
ncbi:MAG: hypothetical protein KDD62_05445 [Bdellovibrionales bacterium]|nr:hypothetical protein [Bdellovibrionales bacterium]